MTHNFKVNCGGARISVNSTYDQVGLRVQTSMADRQGRRMEDLSLEIGGPRSNEPVRVSGSGYLQPDEYLPMASEDFFMRQTRDSRMRGIQQQSPSFDGYEVGRHDATDRGSYGRSYDRPRQSLHETAAAATAAAHAVSSSRQSEASDGSYYRPVRVSTSRPGIGTGYEYEYVIPAHETRHGMGGEWVQYNSTCDFGAGRIERPGASESFHSRQASQPSHHSSPSISIRPPTPHHEAASRNSYHSADQSSYSISSSDSGGTAIAASTYPSSSSSTAGYRGSEMILYAPSPSSSYFEQCSRHSTAVYEGYQEPLECSESTCESYHDDDGGGGVTLRHRGRAWPGASYPHSNSEDNEW